MAKVKTNEIGNETAPAFQIVKGSVDAIPAELLSRSRNEYDWGALEVGDHVVITNQNEFAKVRSSATAYGRGTKTRAARNFSTRTVDVGKDANGKEIKHLEIWRLADLTVNTPVNPVEEKQTEL